MIPKNKILLKKLEDVDMKMPSTSRLVKKTDFKIKTAEIKTKYLIL